jgi:transketolase
VALSQSEEKQFLGEILDLKGDILRMIFNAQSGHPGGSLSCVNIIYLLYTKIMNINVKNPRWGKRDIFILSKGHAAPALYAVLSKAGFFDSEELTTLRKYDSLLQGHPVKNETIGIEISTGSLGMGLSIGVGCSLAAKLDKLNKKIFVLLGDGELNEGAIWEAAMAASHYKLDNLIAIIDRNGIQIDGSTEEIMALEPLSEKWRSFGWEVIEVDGGNINELYSGLIKCKQVIGKPVVLISYLIKGSEISFMEHTKKYHGRPPSKEEFERALGELYRIKEKLFEGEQ